jgi:hypothetical protein
MVKPESVELAYEILNQFQRADASLMAWWRATNGK